MRAARRRQGFTLVETLVAAAVTLVLSALVVYIYRQVNAAVGHSGSRVELFQRSRTLVSRLQPVVSSAVSRNGFGAVRVYDEDFVNLTDACRLELTTNEDLLNLDYRFQDPFLPSQSVKHFQVRFIPDQQKVVLEQLKTDLTGQLTLDETIPPRVLSHRIQGFGIAPESQSLLQIKILTGSYRLDSTLPIPFFNGR